VRLLPRAILVVSNAYDTLKASSGIDTQRKGPVALRVVAGMFPLAANGKATGTRH